MPNGSHCCLATAQGRTGWQADEGERSGHILFSRDLRSLPGNGIFHGLQLFQQLLAAGQCVAGFAGARPRAGA